MIAEKSNEDGKSFGIPVTERACKSLDGKRVILVLSTVASPLDRKAAGNF